MRKCNNTLTVWKAFHHVLYEGGISGLRHFAVLCNIHVCVCVLQGQVSPAVEATGGTKRHYRGWYRPSCTWKKTTTGWPLNASRRGEPTRSASRRSWVRGTTCTPWAYVFTDGQNAGRYFCLHDIHTFLYTAPFTALILCLSHHLVCTTTHPTPSSQLETLW